METIIVKLDSKKMENPEISIFYELPEKLEKYTKNKVTDNGYDYLTNTVVGIWLATEHAKEDYPKVIDYISKKKVCGNDLSKTVEIYISQKDVAKLEECEKVYPEH